MEKICALCEKGGVLCNSHVIPKFVTDWIKETSVTKGLRNANAPNKRIEDGVKEQLLCKDCEKLFSKYETYFANKIFHPFLNGQEQFTFNENLNKFITSISWRLLKTSMDSYCKSFPKFKKSIEQAEKNWREYLLGNSQLKFQNHMFFFKENRLNYKKVDKNFLWYMQRAIDGTIATGNDVLFVYFKFPNVFFVSTIKPLDFLGGGEALMEAEKGVFIVGGGSNLIKKGRSIKVRNLAFYPSFEDFLLSRVREAFSKKISEKQIKKIRSLLEKNNSRMLGSKTFTAFLDAKKIEEDKEG